MMIQRSGLKPGMKAMEPHAGDGAIAIAMADIVGVENVTCYELMDSNVRKLRAAGFVLDAPVDFLAVTPTPCHHVVLCNPPFSNGRDIAHIQHAMKFLKPGGVLVGITSTSWQHKESKDARQFRDLLEANGATVEEIPAGAFHDAGTDIRTLMVTIRMSSGAYAAASSLKSSSVSARTQHARASRHFPSDESHEAQAQACLF